MDYVAYQVKIIAITDNDNMDVVICYHDITLSPRINMLCNINIVMLDIYSIVLLKLLWQSLVFVESFIFPYIVADVTNPQHNFQVGGMFKNLIEYCCIIGNIGNIWATA